MSGTSLDGVDAALVETDGMDQFRAVASLGQAYDEPLRDELRQALALAATCDQPTDHPVLLDLERRLTRAHAEAVGQLLAKAGVPAVAVDVIGFHGQTLAHRPERGWTWQIGDGARLAAMTGCAVVNDFRSADVAAGGQGAPLVPLFHAALVRQAGLVPPVVVANIGGVANVTWIGRRDSDLLAFDTGPGNALIDDWMLAHTGEPLDRDGRMAATGQVDAARIADVLAMPWFDAPPPKSLDRNAFASGIADGLAVADGAATLTVLTAAALARAARHFPRPAGTWIIAGGGRHNPALMRQLGEHLRCRIVPADAMNWDGDALEAQAFAYLAVRSLRGLPLSMPGTTGVPTPQPGGRLHPRPVSAPDATNLNRHSGEGRNP